MARESGDRVREGPSRRRLLARLGTATAGVGSLSGCLDALERDEGPAETATDLDPSEYGPPEAGNWVQTFADHFDEGSLDDSVWSIGPRSAGSRCAGEQVNACFVEDHVHVDGERDRLVLEASAETPEEPADVRPNERGNDYSVGGVRTEGTVAQEFGYFEAAARIPDEPGTLPACWLFCDPFEHDWREMEIFEKAGAAPGDTVKTGTWFEQDDDGPDGDAEISDNEDRIFVGSTEDDGDVTVAEPVDETFIVYALEWGPESLTWYVNGEQVGETSHPGVATYLPGQPLHWVLNHNVYEPAPWVGDPADADFPTRLEFEWVRSWQREEWA